MTILGVACMVLLAAVTVSIAQEDGGAQDHVAYRDVVPRGSYRSDDSFDGKGMGNLYAVTDLFLDAARPPIPPQDAFPNSSAIELVERIAAMDADVLWYYARFTSLTCLGLLLAIAVPVAGFAFCVCHCSCRCSQQEPPGEKDRDVCKRAVLGVLLFCLVTVVLFGIVCAFVTNEYFENGVRRVDPTVESALDDLNLYLNNTQRAVDNLLVTNFHELQSQLDALLDGCGERVKTRLAEISSAVAIDNLTTIVSGLDTVRADLDAVVQHSDLMRDKARHLNQALMEMRGRLKNLLRNCADSMCDDLRKNYDLNSLGVRPQILQLPDISGVARDISRLISEDIEAEVTKGKVALDGIGASIQRAVNKTVPEIQRVVRNVGVELARLSGDMGAAVRQFRVAEERVCITPECNPHVQTYSFARYCLGMAMCLVLFLVTFFIIGGLLCGFCGRKTSIYSDDSCTKGTGSKFLMVSVHSIFIIYFFLMAATTALFVVGGLTQHIVCDSLISTSPDAVIAGTNYVVKSLNSLSPNLRLPTDAPEIIARCHQNLSIYHVLQLQRTVDVDDVGDYKRRFQIDAKVAELTRRVNLEPGITLLTQNARKQLLLLAESSISDIDFAAYASIFSEGVVGMNISHLTTMLGEIALLLQNTNQDSSAADSLRTEVFYLNSIQEKFVSAMLHHSVALKASLENLQRDIGNKNSFRQAVTDLIHQADNAQTFIQKDGKTRVIKLAQEITAEFTSYLDEYADRATFQVKEEIGKCWPVSKAANATIAVVCKDVILPFNGFWASVGWCLLLFVPILVVAVALAELYKKPEPYAIPLTESDCFSENYPDRDTIPLAHNRGGRRHGGRKQESYDNQNGYPSGFSPSSPTAPPVGNGMARMAGSRNSTAAAAAYEDYELDQPRPFRSSALKSAPLAESSSTADERNSWELTTDPPPPHYSSASSLQEFERPPPYYYPGPNVDRY